MKCTPKGYYVNRPDERAFRGVRVCRTPSGFSDSLVPAFRYGASGNVMPSCLERTGRRSWLGDLDCITADNWCGGWMPDRSGLSLSVFAAWRLCVQVCPAPDYTQRRQAAKPQRKQGEWPYGSGVTGSTQDPSGTIDARRVDGGRSMREWPAGAPRPCRRASIPLPRC